jgi:hypothetical protein
MVAVPVELHLVLHLLVIVTTLLQLTLSRLVASLFLRGSLLLQ